MVVWRVAAYGVGGLTAFALACVCAAALGRDRARAVADEDAPIATGMNDWAASAPPESSPGVQPADERARAEAVENTVVNLQSAATRTIREAGEHATRLELITTADVSAIRTGPREIAFAEPPPVREARAEISRAAATETGRRPDAARVYAFAAVKGDAAGMVLRGKGPRATEQPRWAVEKIANIGDMQLGVGWRKGAVQASLALVDRQIEIKGFESRETFLAFTISVKPRRNRAQAVHRV